MDNRRIRPKAKVGETAFVSDRYSAVYSPKVGKVTGVLYVQDRSLRYDILTGEQTLCCACCADGYELSAIQSVEVAEDRVINMAVNPTDGDRVQQEFVMESELTIVMVDGSKILTSMTNAVDFAKELRKVCGIVDK